ncbi:MAG: hypothetical protein SVY10_03385 [Thermodesulfobacteriota bacterium]|nr:hypothetical protein [Thermodesulfobacteriota bacterium]
MGEIKSTLELAMERAGKIEVSSEEKERIRKERYISKAKGIANRYINGELNIKGLTKELGGLEEFPKDIIEKILFTEFVDAVSLSQNNDRLFEAILMLKQDKCSRTVDEMKKICLNFGKEKKDQYENLKNKKKTTLDRAKISGDAVDPEVKSDDSWIQTIRSMTAKYEAGLFRLKEILLEQPESS